MKLSDLKYSSAASSVILFIWVLIVSVIPGVWLSLTERMTLVQSVTNAVLPLGIYILLMSLSRHIGRTSLWMIIVMFFAAFQLVLLYMYGRSVIAVDMFLNVVTTNPGEVGELLGNLLPVMAMVVLFYLIPIIFSVVAVIRKWRLPEHFMAPARRTGFWVTGIGLVCFAVSFFQPLPYNPLKEIFPLNAMYNVAIAIDRTSRTLHYGETSADFTYSAASERSDTIPEIYVAVIGETSRADNWQLLGYRRSTNPLLARKEGIVGFDKAISQSNTTHKSVPLLLSDLDADTFGDSIYVTKSLISAFREAGFATAYISNQNRNRSFIDFFGEEADTTIFIRDFAPQSDRGGFDTDLLPYIDKALDASRGKLLVVLHTYGSHFNYYDRYPRSLARFTPDGPVEATRGNRPSLLNAYDNSILVTDSLLAGVIDRLEATGKTAAMIYTSDHGEDIFDDSRRLFLHASPCPSYYQIHVPFLVWFSSRYRSAYPQTVANAVENRGKFVASSQAYFHTLMEIAGLRSPRVNALRSLVNPSYTPEPPRYLNDHNESVTWIDAGLLPPDFQRLDSLLHQ